MGEISQIGIIVRDLVAGMDHYGALMGLGPWRVHVSSAPPIRCTYEGREVSYSARIAMARAGSILVELIQPLEGESTYHDFLAEHGEGLHHFAVDVSDMDQACRPFTEQGIGVLQSGEGGGESKDGRYVYLDTRATLGAILEFRQPPTVRGSVSTYP